jgi:hypothetical protein
MAFAMQSHVAEMSYAGVDGSAFTYYRGKGGRPRKMFVSRRGKWYKQAADPVTGLPVEPVRQWRRRSTCRTPHGP